MESSKEDGFSVKKVKPKKHYVVKIEADVNDADYVNNEFEYDDDGFKEEGLPIALICYYILGDHLDEHESVESILDEFLPYTSYAWAHTVSDIDVTCNGEVFKLSSIDEKEARKIVKEYLSSSEVAGYHDLEEEDISKMLDDLFPNFKKEVETKEEDITKEELRKEKDDWDAHPTKDLEFESEKIVAPMPSTRDDTQKFIEELEALKIRLAEITKATNDDYERRK